eukprot:2852141-Pleurochrysis_carterae.AAC.1
MSEGELRELLCAHGHILSVTMERGAYSAGRTPKVARVRQRALNARMVCCDASHTCARARTQTRTHVHTRARARDREFLLQGRSTLSLQVCFAHALSCKYKCSTLLCPFADQTLSAQKPSSPAFLPANAPHTSPLIPLLTEPLPRRNYNRAQVVFDAVGSAQRAVDKMDGVSLRGTKLSFTIVD